MCSGIFSFSPRWTWDGWLVPSYRAFSSLLLSYCCSHELVQCQPVSKSYNPSRCAWLVLSLLLHSQFSTMEHVAVGQTPPIALQAKALVEDPRHPHTHPAWSPEAGMQIPDGTTTWCKNACVVRGGSELLLSGSKKEKREREFR